MCDIGKFGFSNDIEFTQHLIANIGVACVPGSSFFSDPARVSNIIRFCFCKKEETLLAAGERLALFAAAKRQYESAARDGASLAIQV